MSGGVKQIPVIDIFAGPGGLSEGFSRYNEFNSSEIDFRIKLSIEKDSVARRTLRLRAFVRQFRDRGIPKAYYDYIRGKPESLSELKEMPEWQLASEEAWEAELGKVNFWELHSRIRHALAGAEDWVLLGGPPCQAYSLIGRARMVGTGKSFRNVAEDVRIKEQHSLRQKFSSDERHNLYKQYLEIVALHQPTVFVMENVRGILSSRAPVIRNGLDNGRDYEYIFDHILEDLADPESALESGNAPDKYRIYKPDVPRGYKIHSFVVSQDLAKGYSRNDYLIEAKRYGLPQRRHRVILFGIRDDAEVTPEPLTVCDNQLSVDSVLDSLPPLRSGRSRAEDSAEHWLAAIRDGVTEELLNEIVDPEVRKRIREIKGRTSTSLTRGGKFIQGCYKPDAAGVDMAKWIFDPDLGGVCQHETRLHMDSDFIRYLYAAVFAEVHGESPKLDRFPDQLLPAHHNVRSKDGKKREIRDFKDRFRVQVSGLHSSTITSHLQKDGHYFIHYDPEQCRSLTVREAARLQTFPDNYFFEGTRTQQYVQVGNAVPPFLALKLADVVAGVLEKVHQKRNQGTGKQPGLVARGDLAYG